MKLRTLVLEGDKEAERKAKTEFPPVRTKSEYLRRKKRQSLPPLRNRSFYLCRMIEEELRGVVIDGSGKITVCAHNSRVCPGGEKYICDRAFRVSIYYLEPEQIDAIERAADEDTEGSVLPELLRGVLLDIARRSGGSEDVVKKIEDAFARMADSRYVREEQIARLSKRSGSAGPAAQVWRVLSEEAGEGWYIKILDGKGNLLRREAIGGCPGYVDRLGSGLYARSEWRGDAFVILERFGKVVYSVSL